MSESCQWIARRGDSLRLRWNRCLTDLILSVKQHESWQNISNDLWGIDIRLMELFYRKLCFKAYIYIHILYESIIHCTYMYIEIYSSWLTMDVVTSNGDPFLQGIREGIAELFWGTLKKALGKSLAKTAGFWLKNNPIRKEKNPTEPSTSMFLASTF